jgi:hypothetical protein
MAEPDAKIILAADLARARAALGRNIEALRRDLDVASHFKQSFHENKAAYIGGATFFGLLLSKLPARKKKVYVERKTKGAMKEAEKAGLLLMIAQFLFKTFRPLLMSLVTKQVTEFVKSRGQAKE